MKKVIVFEDGRTAFTESTKGIEVEIGGKGTKVKDEYDVDHVDRSEIDKLIKKKKSLSAFIASERVVKLSQKPKKG